MWSFISLFFCFLIMGFSPVYTQTCVSRVAVCEHLFFSLLSDHTCFLCSVSERRNSLGSDVLFLGKSHPLFDFIHELYRTESNEVRNPTPSVSIHFSQINQSKLYLFTSFHTIKIQLKVLYTLKTENKQKYTHASPWLHPLIIPVPWPIHRYRHPAIIQKHWR